MNREIEEMAAIVSNSTYEWANEPNEEDFCPVYVAKAIYKEGYRKAYEGEWIDRYKGAYANPMYVCSVCDKGTLLVPHINELGQMEMVQAFSQFCPHCGAKMKYESEGADDV